MYYAQFFTLCLISNTIIIGTSQECSTLHTCSQCFTRNSSCAWCNDQDAFSNFTGGSREPAMLCGVAEELIARGCSAQNIVNPQGETTVIDDIDTRVITPASATVTVRPGIEQTFNVMVSPPQSVPVDMYVLMDLSFTMRAHRDNLAQFAHNLVDLMQDLANNSFRIAFGSFVDKPVSPFIEKFNREFPCAAASDLISPEECTEPYAFKHHLSFTTNAELFHSELRNATLSSSLDNPESLLDAMLQVATCVEELDWSRDIHTRKLLLVFTDNEYHYASDGRLAGLTQVPGKTCRLNSSSNRYDDAVSIDYPSSALVAEVLNEQGIIPIFAVTRETQTVYHQLADIIRSAFVGELNADSVNILEVIQSQYEALSSTIVPVINGIDGKKGLTVTALPIDCSLANNTVDTCKDVYYPHSVTYRVTVSATSEYCEHNPADTSATLQYVGFGDITVNISVLCSCDCERDRELLSSQCNGVGTYECSTCLCDDSHIGPTCSCSTGINNLFGCSLGGSECSGRGDCVCDSCQCHEVPGLLGHTYQGPYCECNPDACPLGIHDATGLTLPCAGHGSCDCNSFCQCDDGFSGLACECSSATDTCVAPGDEALGTVCSGAGECVCGACVCNNYTERYGRYCQECRLCSRSCSTLQSCIECVIEGDWECTSSPSCAHINVTTLATYPNYGTPNFRFRNCSVSHEQCVVEYNIDQYLLGQEDTVHVHIDTTQRDYITWRNNKGDCNEEQVIWYIPVTIIIVVVIVVGLGAIVAWKVIVYIGEYLEYRNWESGQDDVDWHTYESNPLFVDPTLRVTNPAYLTETLRRRNAEADSPQDTSFDDIDSKS